MKTAPDIMTPIANPSSEPGPITGPMPTHVLIDRSSHY
jgi:hypothetical protein